LLAAQVDDCVLAGDEDDGLWDDGDEDKAEFVDHAHDESMVSGLMGMTDMNFLTKSSDCVVRRWLTVERWGEGVVVRAVACGRILCVEDDSFCKDKLKRLSL
jgi:hypothetical protein